MPEKDPFYVPETVEWLGLTAWMAGGSMGLKSFIRNVSNGTPEDVAIAPYKKSLSDNLNIKFETIDTD